MDSDHLQALRQRNRNVFDSPLDKIGKLLEATSQAKIMLVATIAAQKVAIQRAKALLERCDKLLNETQELGEE